MAEIPSNSGASVAGQSHRSVEGKKERGELPAESALSANESRKLATRRCVQNCNGGGHWGRNQIMIAICEAGAACTK